MGAKLVLGIAFRLQTRGDSPVAADRRLRAVEHEASGQRRTTCPHAGVLVKDPNLSDALVSAQWGERLDTASDSSRFEFRHRNQGRLPALVIAESIIVGVFRKEWPARRAFRGRPLAIGSTPP